MMKRFRRTEIEQETTMQAMKIYPHKGDVFGEHKKPTMKRTIAACRMVTDRGRAGRPGIKGTKRALDKQIQELLLIELPEVETLEPKFKINHDAIKEAVDLIEFKAREAYRVWSAA
jgi:hypothetical protein